MTYARNLQEPFWRTWFVIPLTCTELMGIVLLCLSLVSPVPYPHLHIGATGNGGFFLPGSKGNSSLGHIVKSHM